MNILGVLLESIRMNNLDQISHYDQGGNTFTLVLGENTKFYIEVCNIAGCNHKSLLEATS